MHRRIFWNLLEYSRIFENLREGFPVLESEFFSFSFSSLAGLQAGVLPPRRDLRPGGWSGRHLLPTLRHCFDDDGAPE